jgi:hypothetical protein
LFGGQWKEKDKILCLAANGRRRKGSLLGGQLKEKEKVFAWWPMEGEGEGSFLPLPTFPPSIFT